MWVLKDFNEPSRGDLWTIMSCQLRSLVVHLITKASTLRGINSLIQILLASLGVILLLDQTWIAMMRFRTFHSWSKPRFSMLLRSRVLICQYINTQWEKELPRRATHGTRVSVIWWPIFIYLFPYTPTCLQKCALVSST